MKEKAFYLKINRGEEFAFKNLSRWIDVSYLLGADCYIICDDEEIEKMVHTKLLLYRDIVFIKSERHGAIYDIVENIANRNWKNAAYAHLTSFAHSYENYSYFWNIDADDTRFCVSIDRMAQILLDVQNYAEKNQIDCFSLDMWRSETRGKHWSFGVSYINGGINWIGLCKQRCRDEGYLQLDTEGNRNIDWFFTYLKQCTERKIETFYVENLKFIHYTTDFFEKPIGAGLYHWGKGKLTYPLVEYGAGIKELGSYPIARDVRKIDVGLTDKEASEVIAYYAREGKDLGSFYDIHNLVNKKLIELKFERFLKDHGYEKGFLPEIICFGAGNALKKNVKKIEKIYPVKRVCDNDPKKWGEEILKGIRCISPDKLRENDKAIVIVFVYSVGATKQIETQLQALGAQYDSMNRFLLCVE